MLNNKIRLEFLRLKVCGQRSAISNSDKQPKDTELVVYLRTLLDSRTLTEPEDIGFCLWNLSDNLAFLRDSEGLRENFLRFRTFTVPLPAPYQYWCICDGTQRAALETGGYGDLWWETYRAANDANHVIFPENENIVFAAHRTAVTYPPALGKYDAGRLDYAFGHFEKFISSAESSDQHAFHRLIYESSLMQNYGSCHANLCDLCSPFYAKLTLPKVESASLIGEWAYQNAPRCPYDQAVVGILAAVNALVYAGQREPAEMIYETARKCGLTSNRYVEKRLYTN